MAITCVFNAIKFSDITGKALGDAAEGDGFDDAHEMAAVPADGEDF